MLNYAHSAQSSTNFHPPHSRLDPHTCDLDALTDNMSFLHMNFARQGLSVCRDTKIIPMDVVNVNFMAEYCDLPKTATYFDGTNTVREAIEKRRAAPASADDTPATESSESTQAGDERSLLHHICPLTPIVLEYHGYVPSFLPPDRDDYYISATGVPISKDLRQHMVLLREARSVSLLSRDDMYRLQSAVQPMLTAAFDMTSFKQLNKVLYAIHGYQLLHIVLSNRTF